MSKKALVMGMGISGAGAAHLLEKTGWQVCVYDNARTQVGGYENRSGYAPDKALQGVDMVVLSPGVPLDDPIVEYARLCGTEVIGEIELAYRSSRGEIVAVTGTNGKTTVTLLMREILAAAGIESYALGNIGQSFAEKVTSIGDRAVVVLELSSFQLESIAEFRSRYAVCLNITPDHYERHKTFEEYTYAKRKIFLNQTQGDYAVLNYDDETVRSFERDVASEVYFFSVTQRVKGCYLQGDDIYFCDDQPEYITSVKDMRMNGIHNVENALACITVAKLMGIDNKSIVSALRRFTSPRFRLEYSGIYGGKRIYNDSKATNIDSTIKACRAMKGSTALIMGGYDKGISYDGFFDRLPDTIKHIIVTGDNAYSVQESLPDEKKFSFEIVPSLYDAVIRAQEKDVDNILFSPSTSSYDRYTDFVERGEAFDCIIRATAHD